MGQGRWVARCPAHKDERPSLSISHGTNGILLKCFAGCSLESITASLGIRVSDLFHDAYGISSDVILDEGEIAARHYWYGELLNSLALSPEHANDLAERGLGASEIEKSGCRSFCRKAASAIRPGRVLPGFTLENGWFPVGGMLIPVLDPSGRIWAICVKNDSGPKYIWYSLGGLGKVFHCDITDEAQPVLVIEGILKSQIAGTLGNFVNVIGVGGTTNWKGFSDWASRRKKTRFILAFDQDGNAQTGVELGKLRENLIASGHTVSVLTWKGAKGLDDALHAGVRITESSWNKGSAAPRGLPGASPDEFGGLVCRPLSAIQPRDVSWLIDGWIPLGAFSKLDGDPGEGKGFVIAQLASLISRGAGFPGSDDPREPANVVIINNEDDPECITGPRLLAAGANPDRVFVVSTGEEPFCLPKHLDRLRILIEDTQAKFVVLDPFPSFLDSAVNTVMDRDVRSVMVAIADLAAKTQCAIMGVFHLNKSSDSRAMYRSSGSVAFNGQARSAFMVLKDPEDGSRRYLWNFKNNWGRLLGNFAMQFEENRYGTQLTFQGIATADLQEILKGQHGGAIASTRIDAVAKSWLAGMLEGGAKDCGELELLASRVGISWASCRKAADDLCGKNGDTWSLKSGSSNRQNTLGTRKESRPSTTEGAEGNSLRDGPYVRSERRQGVE